MIILQYIITFNNIIQVLNSFNWLENIIKTFKIKSIIPRYDGPEFLAYHLPDCIAIVEFIKVIEVTAKNMWYNTLLFF